MAAGRTAADGNEIRIPAVGGDVFLDPRQRALHVDNVVGPGVARRHPVVQRHAYPAARSQMAHQRIRLRAAPPQYPGAAGHLYQHRCLGVAWQVAAAPDVGQVGPPVWAVAHDVRRLDVAPACHGGTQREIATSATHRFRGQGSEFLSVVGPELFGQARFEHRSRGGGAAVADHRKDHPGRCR
ncbi:Uncharacterised protein [Mycobacterium tuberculosis]|nr:Uncharacterised protein [Mycobacterium tuberculosis]